MKRSRAADFFGHNSDDGSSESEEEGGKFSKKHILDDGGDDESEGMESEEEDAGRSKSAAKRTISTAESEDDDNDDDEEEEEENEKDEKPSKKLKVLTKEELEEKQRQLKKSGVVYISRIPPFMKPEKMRHILQRFGQVNRIFLSPEDPQIRARRAKYGGNKKKSYTEGWAEFVKKKHAKLAAETLNGNPIGGKKGNFYYDDILNVKYLHKFKWNDLTEQITRESQSRQEKLRAEIAKATRENKTFIANVERAKMIEGIQQKRGKKDDTIRRTFDQKKTTTARTDASKPVKTDNKVSKVLRNVF